MNWLDTAISYIAPAWGLRRMQARALMRSYEAAIPSRLRKTQLESSTADQAIAAAGRTLSERGRYLEQNYDLARGILNTMVDHIVGPDGIQIEPQPKRMDGSIHEEFAELLYQLYADFCKRPETTGMMRMPKMQRMQCRTWIRDGEQITQMLKGNVRGLNHGTKIPLTLELLEPDYLPLDYNDESQRIVQGIEKNIWGQVVAYHLHKRIPGTIYYAPTWANDTTRVPADRILHLAATDRLHQTRGVSMFASIITRLADIKDYDESERVAARIAAAMAVQVIKGDASSYMPAEGKSNPRSFPIEPGMVFDQLLPGERMETLQSNRPSPMAEPFRNSMMRAAAAGVNTSYSSISRNYNGTYSSQRQELVEQDLHYRVLRNEFVDQNVMPTYEMATALSIATGLAEIPDDLNPMTLFDALYSGPAMVWIDPDKEARSEERRMQTGSRSLAQTIRAAGGNPREVYAQIVRERNQHQIDGMVFTSNAANTLNLMEPVNDETKQNETAEN